jgi:hypothetical protein
MVEADWGLHTEPGWFDPEAWPAGPVHSDEPDDVPEVKAARVHGFFTAHEAPLWCFVPAIWPSEARAWVRDLRVRQMTRQCDDGPLERLPWTTADYAEQENDINGLLAELGLPPRPAGRIWLLRAPVPYTTPREVLDDIAGRWQRSGELLTATPELVRFAQHRLHEIF